MQPSDSTRKKTAITADAPTETAAWLFAQDLEIALELLREGVNQAHPQSLSRVYVECWRKTDAFVPHGYHHHIVLGAGERNPDSTVSGRIGVLDRVGDKFVHQERSRDCAIRADFNALHYAHIQYASRHRCLDVLGYVREI
jgi:hypothetical protein